MAKDPKIQASSEEEYYEKLSEGENTVVVASRFHFSDLWKTEDWWTIWLGFIFIAIGTYATISGAFDFTATKFSTWGGDKGLAETILNAKFLTKYVLTWAILTAIFSFGMAMMKKQPVGKYAIAFTGMYLLASLAYLLGAQKTMKEYLEYAFWALLIGLLICNTVGTPNWLKPAMQTEFYVKIGLVIMGSEVLFSNITKFGFYGLGIAWIVVPCVIIFMWLFGTKFLKMSSKPMVMVIAVATSVCGVSAAIAAAAACKAKKNDLTFAVGLSLFFTVLMMVFMPMFAKAVGMDPMIGGAWIGNTVDSTGAVILAGEALGPLGAQVAALVKMIQNVLIGFIAFGVALFFALRVEGDGQSSIGASEIWDRFPKFILGFVAASCVFSFMILPGQGIEVTNAVIKNLGTFKGWCFCLTFISIGLESNFKEMAAQMEGGKPMTLYLVGQIFSLFISLFMCWLFLSGVIFPVPDLTLFNA